MVLIENFVGKGTEKAGYRRGKTSPLIGIQTSRKSLRKKKGLEGRIGASSQWRGDVQHQTPGKNHNATNSRFGRQITERQEGTLLVQLQDEEVKRTEGRAFRRATNRRSGNGVGILAAREKGGGGLAKEKGWHRRVDYAKTTTRGKKLNIVQQDGKGHQTGEPWKGRIKRKKSFKRRGAGGGKGGLGR